jgi:hypothetical protein
MPANKNQPIGLRPEGRCIRSTKYIADSTIYPGDTVAIATDGKVDRSVTVPLLGVALNYAVAGDNIMIADHPDQRFIAQADAALAQADVQGNFDLTLGSGNSTYKRSTVVVDAATADNTTATLAVKLLAIGDEIDNSGNAVHNDVIVKINNHVLNGGTGTTGLA